MQKTALSTPFRSSLLYTLMALLLVVGCNLEKENTEGIVPLKKTDIYDDYVGLETHEVIFYFNREKIINHYKQVQFDYIAPEDKISFFLASRPMYIFKHREPIYSNEPVEGKGYLSQMEYTAMDFICKGDCAVYHKAGDVFIDQLIIKHLNPEGTPMPTTEVYLPDGDKVFSMTYP